MEKLEMLEGEELMYTAQISISKNDFEKIRELAVGFIQKVNELAKPSVAEEIINLNLDLFSVWRETRFRAILHKFFLWQGASTKL